MYNNKKAWQKPELTVLVRINPEEAVLVNCKIGQMIGPELEGNQPCVNPGGQHRCADPAST